VVSGLPGILLRISTTALMKPDPETSEAEAYFPDPVPLPIDGVLDLHGIAHRDVKDVLGEYFAECRKVGIFEIRVIHGKGIGERRRMVHQLLETMPDVERFALASASHGAWGATMVYLRPLQFNL